MGDDFDDGEYDRYRHERKEREEYGVRMGYAQPKPKPRRPDAWPTPAPSRSSSDTFFEGLGEFLANVAPLAIGAVVLLSLIYFLVRFIKFAWAG